MNAASTRGKGVKRLFLWEEHLTFSKEGLNHSLTHDTPFQCYILICVQLNVGLYGYIVVRQAGRKTTYYSPLL